MTPKNPPPDSRRQLTSTGWAFVIIGIAFVAVGLLVLFSGVGGIGSGMYGSAGDTYEVVEGPFARLWGLVLIGFGIYGFFMAGKETREQEDKEPPSFGFRK